MKWPGNWSAPPCIQAASGVSALVVRIVPVLRSQPAPDPLGSSWWVDWRRRIKWPYIFSLYWSSIQDVLMRNSICVMQSDNLLLIFSPSSDYVDNGQTVGFVFVWTHGHHHNIILHISQQITYKYSRTWISQIYPKLSFRQLERLTCGVFFILFSLPKV